MATAAHVSPIGSVVVAPPHAELTESDRIARFVEHRQAYERLRLRLARLWGAKTDDGFAMRRFCSVSTFEADRSGQAQLDISFIDLKSRVSFRIGDDVVDQLEADVSRARHELQLFVRRVKSDAAKTPDAYQPIPAIGEHERPKWELPEPARTLKETEEHIYDVICDYLDESLTICCASLDSLLTPVRHGTDYGDSSAEAYLFRVMKRDHDERRVSVDLRAADIIGATIDALEAEGQIYQSSASALRDASIYGWVIISRPADFDDGGDHKSAPPSEQWNAIDRTRLGMTRDSARCQVAIENAIFLRDGVTDRWAVVVPPGHQWNPLPEIESDDVDEFDYE